MIKIGKYLIVSISVTLLDIFMLSFLVEIVQLYYIYSVTISYIIALLSKFWLNKRWVFRTSPGEWMTQLGRFTFVSVTGLFLTNVVMLIGVEYLLMHYLVVKVAAIGIVFIWTYILHNLYSFKTGRDSREHGTSHQEGFSHSYSKQVDDGVRRMMKAFGKALRNLPIDFGQGEMRFDTMAKIIGMREVLSEAKNKTNVGKALDIGCREGRQSRWLKNVGYDVTSVDIEPKYSEALIVDANERLPFPDQHFDLVWCSEIMEHLDNPSSSLNEFLRVTKTDGLVILTTPNSYAWMYRLGSLLGFSPQKIQNPGHKHFFNYANLEKILKSVEYSISCSIWGYFPYAGIKLRTTKRWETAFLSPSFVVRIDRESEEDAS
ncbi:MAG: GtrA family protein [Candidatus Thorarchaeota archaeon]